MGTYIIRDVQNFLIERWRGRMIEPFDVVHDKQKKRLQEMAYLKAKELEVEQLREQNRVLRCAIEEYAKAKTDFDDKRLQEDHHAWRERYTRLVGAETILIALTATSQPEPCTNHFSDGSKIFPSRDCCKPATSQEGQQ